MEEIYRCDRTDHVAGRGELIHLSLLKGRYAWILTLHK